MKLKICIKSLTQITPVSLQGLCCLSLQLAVLYCVFVVALIVCLRVMSSVPSIAIVSGLSILDCPSVPLNVYCIVFFLWHYKSWIIRDCWNHRTHTNASIILTKENIQEITSKRIFVTIKSTIDAVKFSNTIQLYDDSLLTNYRSIRAYIINTMK